MCFKFSKFFTSKRKNYEKIVNDILENIKSLQLSPSVLEELVQKHYIENKKIISLEGNLLRLAMDHQIQEMNLLNFMLEMKLIQFKKIFRHKLSLETIFY